MINYPSDWTGINPSIPFVGKWKSKVSHIEQMWLQPCGASPTLMAFGAFVALPELVFSLLSPDCLDYTFDRVGRPHKRRRRPSFNINDYMDGLAPPTGKLGWAMFTGAQLAQRFGFYALVVDSFLNWFIAGTSLAFRMNGCDDPNQGHATSSMNQITVALLPAQSFTINTWHVDSAHIFTADGVSIVCPNGHQMGAGFSVTQIPNVFPTLPDCSFSCHLFDFATGWRGPDVAAEMNPQGKIVANFGNGVPPPTNAGHSMRVRCEKTFGVMICDGLFTAGGLNLSGFEPTACGHSLRDF